MLNAYGAVPIMGPWQGGLAQPVGPPSRPRFGTGALTLVSQTDASSGSVVSYVGGIFAAQFWTVGHPVPFLVRELDPEDVQALRDELSEQLEGPSAGLDEVPLRAFVAAAEAYVATRSERFSGRACARSPPPLPARYWGAQLAQRRDRNSAREPAGGRGPVAHPVPACGRARAAARRRAAIVDRGPGGR